MSAAAKAPAACFYGDDFTGAAENLAQFHRHGLRCRLYFEPAAPERVKAEAGALDVVGIAGVARSKAPAEMRDLLRPAFTLFAELGARLVQYKICSTFDSAPEVGNYRIAMETAHGLWPEAVVPVYPATPDFGRYTAFANLFSRHRDAVLRLDRNPAMVNHPSTPMDEADLRRHLGRLGAPDSRAVMLHELAGLTAEALARLIAERGAGGAPVVIDTVDNDQLAQVGAALWQLAEARPVFALAAQGLPQGLGGTLARLLDRHPTAAGAGSACEKEPALVLSGSCAEQTAAQLAMAEAAGWRMIELPVSDLAAGSESIRRVGAEAGRALGDGQSVAVFTARGKATAAFEATRAPLVGAALATIFRKAVAEAGVRRVIFAGGDSSSHAMRASGAYALEIAASTGRQANHCCRLLSDDALDGVEVILKGGQAGDDDFFLRPLAT